MLRPETKRPPLASSASKLPYYLTPKKRWKVKRADNLDDARRTHNTVIDMSYMSLLNKVKAMYQDSGIQVFERNLRDDRSFTAVGMHCFCTSDLYLELLCGYDLICRVNYDFERCPYETQITNLLNSTYALDKAAMHTPLKGGVSTYLKGIIAFQGTAYLSNL